MSRAPTTDHEHDERVGQCARFLIDTPPQARPRPLLPALREMFGINSADVIAAIRASHQGGVHVDGS